MGPTEVGDHGPGGTGVASYLDFRSIRRWAEKPTLELSGMFTELSTGPWMGTPREACDNPSTGTRFQILTDWKVTVPSGRFLSDRTHDESSPQQFPR
jgi:hypothetical protein